MSNRRATSNFALGAVAGLESRMAALALIGAVVIAIVFAAQWWEMRGL